MASSLATAGKVHKTAVALVPPRHLWPHLQAIRVFNDKSFTRWPPHINLLYPFLEPATFAEAAVVCQQALQSVDSFAVNLSELSVFEHGRSCTLWAKPEATALLGVQAALSQAFPQCSDLSSDPSRGIQAFTPHLSLGQWRTRAEVEAAERQVAASWQPLSFEAGGVVLLSRQGFADPFSFHYFVPFGGRPPVAFRPPLPYIATVGGGGDEVAASTGTSGGSQPTSDLRQRLAGIGAATPDGSVWNFAFGANMSPRKLNGARGLHPLESLPARLPGWRLTFTHRGGMGNIVRQVAGASPGPAGDGKEERACVHGVLHRLSPSDYGRLADMEHEYRPLEVQVLPHGGTTPVTAVAFVTPEEKRIAEGLPPSQRYLTLLQEGARHWQLDAGYTAWLEGLTGIDGSQRGTRYYQTAAGEPLPALPKIRTGSQQQQQQRQQQRRRRPQGGRGKREGPSHAQQA